MYHNYQYYILDGERFKEAYTRTNGKAPDFYHLQQRVGYPEYLLKRAADNGRDVLPVKTVEALARAAGVDVDDIASPADV